MTAKEAAADQQYILDRIWHDLNDGTPIGYNDGVFLLDLISGLSAQLATMTRERDAAVSDLTRLANHGEECDCCKHCCDKPEDVFPCEYEEWCNMKRWEWRGPQGESVKDVPDAQAWIVDDHCMGGDFGYCPYCGKPSAEMPSECPHCGEMVAKGRVYNG